MKRISLILTALMLLSFGLAQGQTTAISLDAVQGYFSPNNIAVGQNVKFSLRVFADFNSPTDSWGGFSNALDLYSPNGATWGAPTIAWASNADVTALFSAFGAGNFFLGSFSADGAVNDTLSMAGFESAAPFTGYTAVFNNVLSEISTSGFPLGDAGKTICLDSCQNFPPTNVWTFGGFVSGGDFPPTFGTGPFASLYVPGNGYCFTLFVVPNLPPVISGCPVSVSGSHCAILSQGGLTALDADGPTPITWTTTLGTVSPGTGGGPVTWSYQPTCADVGQNLSASVIATDGLGAADTCTFNVVVTNVAPVISSGCGAVVPVGKGLTGTTDLNATAGDCDATTWSLGTVTPAPVGTISIDNNGTVTFNTNDPGDGGINYTVEVIATDCAGAADTCTVEFDVLILTPYSVKIEKTHGTIQGQHEFVDVTLEGGSQPLGGFDFLISYDASALNFISAIEGAPFYAGGCGWEYFTYRYSAFGNCNNACASGKVRVVGIAETNNGANHPSCFLPGTLPAVMFRLDFLVSDNRTFECQYVPIRFVWFDCGDNTLSNPPGDTLYISRNVYDFDLIGNIADSNGTYPTWNGAQHCNNPDPNKPDPVRFIDFYNGGIDIVCADSIDARGDINLNGLSNEIADAVLFSNYFVHGLSVFNVNVQGQIAASDVNADGIALSVADLVYLVRIVIGDANPFPKVAPASIEATYTVANGEVSIDATVAAASIVVSGNVTPTLLANNMDMQYAFDGTNTRILVYTNVENSSTLGTFSGTFIAVNGDVVSAEFATPEGGVVVAKGNLVAKNFILNQNYPNPFNPKTRISFSLPKSSEYTLTIYNITGQKVQEVSATGNAGLNEYNWDASQQASGVYFYKLTAGTFSETKKMVFLK